VGDNVGECVYYTQHSNRRDYWRKWSIPRYSRFWHDAVAHPNGRNPYDSTLAIVSRQGGERSLTIDERSQRSGDRRRTSHETTPARRDQPDLGPVGATLFGARLAAGAGVAPGAVLTPGSRTVTGAVRVMGLALDRPCTHDPRGLHRAPGSARHGSRRL
jgi:hypothetical protein